LENRYEITPHSQNISGVIFADLRAAQIEATLAWMWMHVSAAEEQLSTHQLQNDNQNLPATNDTTIPATPKLKTDPAPVLAPVPIPAPFPVAAPVPVTVPADDGLQNGGEARSDDAEPSTKRPKVNTTMFPFWPNVSDTKDTVPVDNVEDTSDTEKQQEERRQARWLALALTYPEKDILDGRWHGVHFLGEGSTGQVGLWIRVDDQRLIREVRDDDVYILQV
jgi:hypothetical protein